MSKKKMKPGNMVYPVPAALVSCADKDGHTNLLTVAWTGTICSDPAMVYISVRPERYSYHMIKETGEFVLNLTNEAIIRATDFCGVRSGRDVDKWKETGLTPAGADMVKAPLVKESPVNIECRVTEVKALGSHNMFIAKVLAVHADEKYFDEAGRFDLNKAGLVAYNHGSYMSIGDELGTFGYSVKKTESKEVTRDKTKESGNAVICPYSKKCGGCDYSGLEYEKQLKKKQKYITGLLNEFSRPEEIIGMEYPYYYRNKVHRVFGYDKKSGIISGNYAEGTHKLSDIESCLLEDKKSQEIIRTVQELCISFNIKIFDEDTGKGFLRHVLVRRGFTTGNIMVVLVCANFEMPGKNNFIKALRDEHPEITTIVLNVNNKKTSMVLGEREKVLFGNGYIEDMLCGCRFRISSKSFYQVNPVQTEVLYKKAIEFAGLKGGETLIDAYCGIGTIGICAAKAADIELVGVELNKDAVADARINAKENGIKKFRFVADDATKWMSEYSGKADVVFMDPPRTGSTEKFIKTVSRLNPERIVYVSCGPDTLARDLKAFKKHGYFAKRIQPVDMFPLTGHVECVVEIQRVNH